MLVLQLQSEQRLEVGSLGPLQLKSGWYLYVGSAFGPSGVQARCGHHRKISSRPRWHIDYLRAVAELREIWFSHDPERREHQWAGWVKNQYGTYAPFPGFGSSDCDCESHLLYIAQRPSFDRFRRHAYRTISRHATIKRECIAPLDE